MKQRLDSVAATLRGFTRVATLGFLLAVGLAWLGWLPDFAMTAAGVVLITVVIVGWLVGAARALLGR